MRKTLSLIVAFVISFTASAKVTLPKVLGSNMVLQQQSDVNLWGTAKADKKVTVTVSWNKKRHTLIKTYIRNKTCKRNKTA